MNLSSPEIREQFLPHVSNILKMDSLITKAKKIKEVLPFIFIPLGNWAQLEDDLKEDKMQPLSADNLDRQKLKDILPQVKEILDTLCLFSNNGDDNLSGINYLNPDIYTTDL